MAVKLAFNGLPQFFDSNSVALSGGLLYTYEAGTTTAEATYQDSAGATPHTNPIVLDSRGEPPALIWLTVGQSYKFVLKTSAGVTIWTADNITGINDVESSVDEWVASGLTATFVSTTSFTVADDKTVILHAGRRLKITDGGGTKYAVVKSSAYTTLTTVVVVVDSGGVLANPISTISYGLLTATNPSSPLVTDEHPLRSGSSDRTKKLRVEVDNLTTDTTRVLTMQDANLVLGAIAVPAKGRLTLTSATPVTTSDVTAATTVYFTPYKGDTVQLYDGTEWNMHEFTEMSQAISDATKSPAAGAASKVYDMFVWMDSGTLRCTRGPAWSSDTSRGTGAGTSELEIFEGRYVNKVAITNGPVARRGLYVGSVYSDGSTQFTDSVLKRHVWNMFNRVRRPMRVIEGTNEWTYTTGTLRQANAATSNQVDFVRGLDEDAVSGRVSGNASNSTGNVKWSVAIGLSSTSAMVSGCINTFGESAAANVNAPTAAAWVGLPGVGRYTLVWLEQSQATGTTTWKGNVGAATLYQSGLHAEMLA